MSRELQRFAMVDVSSAFFPITAPGWRNVRDVPTNLHFGGVATFTFFHQVCVCVCVCVCV